MYNYVYIYIYIDIDIENDLMSRLDPKICTCQGQGACCCTVQRQQTARGHAPGGNFKSRSFHSWWFTGCLTYLTLSDMVTLFVTLRVLRNCIGAALCQA